MSVYLSIDWRSMMIWTINIANRPFMYPEDLQDIFVQYLSHEKNVQTLPHVHERGQIYLLNSGMITCHAKEKRWSVTPNCLGWLPANIQHSAVSWGKISGWLLYLPMSLCGALPDAVCLLQSNTLIHALMARIAMFSGNHRSLSVNQKRILMVLLDEIERAEKIDSLLLPMPKDPRLIKITQAILSQPERSRSQSEWANWAGLSVRSLSRHFMNETGMSFSHWRQLAKVILSLEKLAQGIQINEIAYSLGFCDPSAYIVSFKSIFAVSPGNYFTQLSNNVDSHNFS